MRAVAAIVVAALGCGSPEAPPAAIDRPTPTATYDEDAADREIVARVNGVPVFADCVARQSAAHPPGSDDAVRQAALADCVDFELLAQVQSNILGNCLCVLGDSMAMPIGSMLKKFRDEFERHAAEARARNEAALVEQSAPELAASPYTGQS